MAKVTAPLMSLDASGALGKALVFAKWKGINYARPDVEINAIPVESEG